MPKPMTIKTPLAKKLSKLPKQVKREGPLWQGPEDSGPMGGITQSMLGGYEGWLVCRERCRVKNILGLKPNDRYEFKREYGSMWHAAEEELARNPKDPVNWLREVRAYSDNLCRKYPMSQADIIKWQEICLRQFPVYINHWKKHPDVQERTPILQEHVFHVPYTLPSGRTVFLRGKWDAIDLIGKGKNAHVYLQENKSKGDIDAQQLQRQIKYDLQTMMYLIALEEDFKNNDHVWAGYQNNPLGGVRYNVIRRPLGGGRHSIRQREGRGNAKAGAETDQEFYDRLGALIEEETKEAVKMKVDPWFFMRWKIEITPADIQTFKEQTFDPVLEQLCTWYNDATGKYGEGGYEMPGTKCSNYRMPFGVYSPLIDGGTTDLDEYLYSGSTVGLTQATTLFEELQ